MAAFISRSKRAGGECLFNVGNGVRRGAALVALCFPVAGGLFSFHGPFLGRSLRGLRRAGLADAQADFAATHAAGVFLSPAADLHSRLRVVRNSGAGGAAGGYSRFDDIDSARRATDAANLRQGRGLCRAVDVGRGVHALFLFPNDAGGHRFHTITGKGYRPTLIQLGGWRYVTASGLLLYSFVLLVLPFLIVLWASLLPFYIQPSFEAISKFTLKNYITAVHFPKITDSIKNSVLLGLGSATAVMVLTTLASWILVRTKLRGRWLLDLLTTLPLLFPGIVMGLAIMRFYLIVPIPIYGTLWILLVAFVTRYIPYGIRYTHSGLLQLHRELEEAAYASGGSWLNTMRRITMPLLTPSFLGGWVFIFLLSAKELSMSILLVSPQTPVVSVAIYELWENGQVGELAAFGVIWTTILVSIAVAYYLFARRYGIQQQ